jgi:potassium/hydrogen antiporter
MPWIQVNGHSLEVVLLALSALLAFSVLASKISGRSGLPSLLVFLGIGMLAGSEGPGRIDFANYSLAFAIGSVSLAFIVFDGGMRTSWKSVRPILPTGISLASFGVLATAALTGVFAHYVLGLNWIEGLVLGAIVSSTDAAAVFSIMRSRSLALKGSLKQTLEFEAGSNDPMAVFLTIGVLAFAAAPDRGVLPILVHFFVQGGVGLALGWMGGRAIRWLINHAGIEYEGLYSVLLFSLVIVLFSGTSALGGSGFLAVYVAGLLLGNSVLLHKGSLSKFQDGVAWIAQISVFLTLGLLVFPSSLLPLWKEGLLLAAFLMFVARPLSVLVSAPGSTLSGREKLFVSWVGLRGAAPIILATLPWIAQLPNAEYYFNLVFFVVLISVLVQGMSIPWVARKLDLSEPMEPDLPGEGGLGMLPPGFITLELEVEPAAPAVGQRLVDLSLPQGVLLTTLAREGRYLVPKGDTAFAANDLIWCLARPTNRKALMELFAPSRGR